MERIKAYVEKAYLANKQQAVEMVTTMWRFGYLTIREAFVDLLSRNHKHIVEMDLAVFQPNQDQFISNMI